MEHWLAAAGEVEVGTAEAEGLAVEVSTEAASVAESTEVVSETASAGSVFEVVSVEIVSAVEGPFILPAGSATDVSMTETEGFVALGATSDSMTLMAPSGTAATLMTTTTTDATNSAASSTPGWPLPRI